LAFPPPDRKEALSAFHSFDSRPEALAAEAEVEKESSSKKRPFASPEEQERRFRMEEGAYCDGSRRA
jgi:hypothetical protein